ncbi:apolipoprotein D and lipocalin family protein [Stenotrophomonas sp. SORGH_AS321]|nr:apolipoprotein D and lipocalin family protein [Stenotrophomonas sp. SORGH_AS_0321]
MAGGRGKVAYRLRDESPMTTPNDLKTVPDLKLPRYLGTWYEIARLPMRHEPEACTDVSANYSLQDNGNIRVHNRCRMEGEIEEAIGEASVVDNDSARLAVSFLPKGLRWLPFTKGDYWVIQIAPDYSVSLVGSPDRDYLWLLSRTPHLDKTVRDHYLATARQQGFDLSKLIDTPHTGKPTA